MAKTNFKNSKTIRFGLVVLFLVSVASLFPQYRDNVVVYQDGMVWVEPDLIAPFSFPIYKSAHEYKEEKRLARQNAPHIFYLSPESFDLKKFNEHFKTIYLTLGNITKGLLPYEALSKFGFYSINEQQLLVEDYQNYIVSRGKENSFLVLFEKTFPYNIQSLLTSGIIDIPKKLIKLDYIIVKNRNGERRVPVNNLKDTLEVVDVFRKLIESQLSQSMKDNARSIIEIGINISKRFLVPTIKFNKEETEQLMNYAFENVPIANGIVKENERIIEKGQLITLEISRKLTSYIRAKSERESSRAGLKIYLGRLLVVICICMIFVLYLSLFYEFFLDNNKLLFVLLCLLTPMVLVWLATYIWFIPPYIMPIGLFAILLSFVFDIKIGFIGVITIALLSGLVRGNDFMYTIAIVVSGCFTILIINKLRTRVQFLLATIATFVGFVVVIFAFGLSKLSETHVLLQSVVFAFGASLANFFSYPLLVMIEKFFNVTTDFTLIELSDINHPLIRNLAKNAIGTYYHSLQVGLFAEEAASAVGANALLCRVGSYFHDIGKVKQPEYFFENQHGVNPHDLIPPDRSVEIILSHVQYGVELGRMYKLPEAIINFISQHHGTSLVYSFYEKAKKELPLEKIDIHKYKYVGKKPQLKEVAIVMICDAVEAAIRSLTIINEQTVEKTVRDIIKSKIDDEQFSECEVTLLELDLIKKSLIDSILSFKHSRNKYPKQTL